MTTWNVKVWANEDRNFLFSESEDVPSKDLLPLPEEYAERMRLGIIDDEEQQWTDECVIDLEL